MRDTRLRQLTTYARFGGALGRFLRGRLTAEEARVRLRRQLAEREEAFVSLIERTVYADGRSPYRKLLDAAGISLEDVRLMVGQNGLEGALERLHDEGVYVTQDEFKGRAPIRRCGLDLQVEAADFDNPLNANHYRSSTSGSRGKATRLRFDFDHLGGVLPSHLCFFDAHGLRDRPVAVWRPAPPDLSGLANILLYAAIGMTPRRWFSQSRVIPEGGDKGAAAITALTVVVSRLAGRGLPKPGYTPAEDAGRVIEWLAAMKRRGTPAILEASASAGVRVAAEARRAGIDISGSVFRLGGEPYTPAKAEVLGAAGVSGLNHYAMMEFGGLGLACAAPNELDDSHVLTGRVAAISRPLSVGHSGETVPGLLFTTLQPTSPKIAINVESGDYGDLEERDCDCALGRLGLRTHISGIRSYDKLTGEGVTFAGAALYELIESVLPSTFGGASTDYQLVEEEDGRGLTRVGIIVSPRVGPVDEAALIARVVASLRAMPKGGRSMTEQWLQSDTLRVIRRDPYETSTAKILPLHLVSPSKAGERR